MAQCLYIIIILQMSFQNYMRNWCRNNSFELYKTLSRVRNQKSGVNVKAIINRFDVGYFWPFD